MKDVLLIMLLVCGAVAAGAVCVALSCLSREIDREDIQQPVVKHPRLWL